MPVVDDEGVQPGQVIARNSENTDYEVIDVLSAAQALALPIQINAQTGTTYTLAATDAGKLVTLANAEAVTVTVPAETFSAGEIVLLAQLDAGQVTVDEDDGVTVSSAETLLLRGQYSAAQLVCLGSDAFLLIGDLEASA